MPVLDQIVNIIRFALAFTLVFTIWPVFLFKSREETLGERLYERYIRMVFLVILLGYFLIAIQLYELLTLSILLLFYPLVLRIPFQATGRLLEEKVTKLTVFVYKFLDGEFHPIQKIRSNLQFEFSLSAIRSSMIPGMLLFLVLAVSAYLRFHDSFHHATPPMSDSYVTLAWMKYLEQNILFHDGIYPQGFHFYLTVLRKFAGQDALYVLKYAGPLNGVLVTGSLYVFVRRLTASPYAGILAAFVFGVLGQYLPIGMERQAATNAQEFALVFMVPAWHLTLSYLEKKERSTLISAFACYAVTGLVHTLIYAFMAMGVFCFLVAYFALGLKKNLKQVGHLALAGIMSGVVSAIPLLAGLIMSKKFHASSVDFINAKLDIVIPAFSSFDQAFFAGVLLYIFVVVLFPSLRGKTGRALAILLISVFSLLLYRYVAPYSGNAVLISRSGILWSVVISLGLGLGLGAVAYGIPRVVQNIILPAACFFAIILGIIYFHPQPPEPYKMQHDCIVNQYLRLSKEYMPTTWMMVSSEEGYDLALGKGWHMHLQEFAENYSPVTKKLYRMDNPDEVLVIQNIFIVIEKDMLRPNFKEMETILARREYYYDKLETWAQRYRQFHNNIQVYYEDSLIKIYHIRQIEEEQESLAEIWGVSK